MSSAAAGLPLSTLLSQVLVAFTIEFDNEAEHRIPHWTTNQGVVGERSGPWLTSMTMYLNCMRFVGADGITMRKVEELARTKTNWHGMQRWGYITVEPDPADSRVKPPRSDWLVRATRKGRIAREIQRALFGEIEQRWRERFGGDVLEQLRVALWTLIRQFTVELPDCLPILKYGFFSKDDPYEKRDAVASEDNSSLYFPSLVSRVLLAFAISFESKSDVSLAIGANVLRVLRETPVKVRELPVLSGVSKESISMAMNVIEKRSLAIVAPDPDHGKAKVACLTDAGRKVQEEYLRLLGEIEQGWVERFGADAIGKLRGLLEQLVGEPTEASPLFQGLTPYPDGWRASVPTPRTLPHYPMVLHRGGYPDGS